MPEEIEVGDLVLSRDAITGETAFKPVTVLIPGHDREIPEAFEIANGDGAVRGAAFETTDDMRAVTPERRYPARIRRRLMLPDGWIETRN